MTGTVRVLVAIGHRVFADAVAHLIESASDLEVAGTATTTQTLVESCRASCPDVVLIDGDLPAMTGFDAVHDVRTACPGTQVVVLTGVKDPGILAGAIDAGAGGFVAKSQPAGDIVEAVRLAASGEMVVPAGDIGPIVRHIAGRRRAHSEAERLLRTLTDREVEILREAARGRTSAEIAEALTISPHTVNSHVKNLMTKLGARSRLEAVLFVVRHGLIDL